MSRELADLLGQVKPPTVSKDEIDKSGLEIIKAAQLSQHENDGKVSSNCLDRVRFSLSIENLDVFVDYNNFLGSVLSVWMIISPRRIFELCHVVMLSIKLALMSGYRLEGIIVLLVEQQYVLKNHLIYNVYSSHCVFPSHPGCDDWDRQLHISYIKHQFFRHFFS